MLKNQKIISFFLCFLFSANTLAMPISEKYEGNEKSISLKFVEISYISLSKLEEGQSGGYEQKGEDPAYCGIPDVPNGQCMFNGNNFVTVSDNLRSDLFGGSPYEKADLSTRRKRRICLIVTAVCAIAVTGIVLYCLLSGGRNSEGVCNTDFMDCTDCVDCINCANCPEYDESKCEITQSAFYFLSNQSNKVTSTVASIIGGGTSSSGDMLTALVTNTTSVVSSMVNNASLTVRAINTTQVTQLLNNTTGSMDSSLFSSADGGSGASGDFLE